jgi:cell division ATPase FtsA
MPIDDIPDQPRTVLAAAMAPEQLQQIRDVCQKAGLRPKRVVLRPCAAASLFCRRQADGRPRVRLLVDLLEDEADLTVMVDRKVIFLRTARLPSDPLTGEDGLHALIAEFRRTMAAVQNQLGGRKVESIVLCGTGPQHAALAEVIDQRLGTPVELFDPFTGIATEGEARRTAPEHPGRFAPLLGLICDEVSGEPHAVDFLHPRKRPEPPSRRRTAVAAAVVALLVIAVPVLWVLIVRAQLQTEVAALREQSEGLKKEIDELTPAKTAVDAIQQWRGSDPVWIDEMRWIAQQLPPAEDIRITELDFNNPTAGNANAKFKVLAKSPESLKTMVEKLSDGKHIVTPTEVQTKVTDKKGYALKDGYSVSIGQQKASKAKGKKR